MAISDICFATSGKLSAIRMPGTLVAIASVGPPFSCPALGSKVSNWLGPPCIHSRIIDLPFSCSSRDCSAIKFRRPNAPVIAAAAEAVWRNLRRRNRPPTDTIESTGNAFITCLTKKSSFAFQCWFMQNQIERSGMRVLMSETHLQASVNAFCLTKKGCERDGTERPLPPKPANTAAWVRSAPSHSHPEHCSPERACRSCTKTSWLLNTMNAEECRRILK